MRLTDEEQAHAEQEVARVLRENDSEIGRLVGQLARDRAITDIAVLIYDANDERWRSVAADQGGNYDAMRSEALAKAARDGGRAVIITAANLAYASRILHQFSDEMGAVLDSQPAVPNQFRVVVVLDGSIQITSLVFHRFSPGGEA